MDFTEKETVVKCRSCEKFFGFSKTNSHCPFCQTNYGEIEVSEIDSTPIKIKKIPVKEKKESFKISKDN